MAAPVDLHVLEESLARVDTLSQEIEQSLEDLSEYSRRAQQSLSPLSNQNSRSGQYKANVDLVLEAIGELDKYAKTLEGLKTKIEAGPAEVGLSEYAKSLNNVRWVHDELMQSDYRNFYRLIDYAQQLQTHGSQKVKQYLNVSVEKCFPPLDSQRYMDGLTLIPLPSHEDVASLRSILDTFKVINEEDLAHTTVSSALTAYLNAALAFPAQFVLGSGEGSAKLKAYTAFTKNLQEATGEAVGLIFAGHPAQQEHYGSLVNDTIQNELTRVSKSVTSTTSQTKMAPNTDSYALFDSIESAKILGSTNSDLAGNVQEAAEKLKEMFRQVDEKTRSASIPTESSVSGATVNMISIMRKLIGYPTAMNQGMESQPPRFWMPSPAPQWASNTSESLVSVLVPFSLYLSDLIECSIFNLQAAGRAAGFTRSSQLGILSLVNLATIEHSISTFNSNQTSISVLVGPHGSVLMQRLHKRALNMFLTDWNKLAGHLMDVTTSSKTTKLSSKDREAVKEKFRLFNSEFEVLLERQKRYNITDSVLRQKLFQEISKLISPLYNRFYEKHRGGDFTKNIDKYIKYDKTQFEAALSSLK
ncbi:Exocyst complex protein EXO70 [Wickerhamiella sorbophila]|uniref:Exocyst complex protein EXO70 n=1 Tax=Wickerhamiella sorbophila TaxID=45607 RepID=A0A2T0FL36_9ASCO|nr:Exocyst complex protein EXO70 [Wickerhamiella sorbophila]PRT55704.1 Exocyst complex protein EXO70 [Wickerhamiella sorbophila]